jgi:hypothetical protein
MRGGGGGGLRGQKGRVCSRVSGFLKQCWTSLTKDALTLAVLASESSCKNNSDSRILLEMLLLY